MKTICTNDLLNQTIWNSIMEKYGDNWKNLQTKNVLNQHEQILLRSQNGEEGILKYIFDHIGFTNKVCVEFGALDGVLLSNTLYFHNNWDFKRILIEGCLDKKNHTKGEKIIKQIITPDNINNILDNANCPPIYDLLSIDIDGDDYWVWKAMTNKARVVIVEYHCAIPNEKSLAIMPGKGEVKSHLAPIGWNEHSTRNKDPKKPILDGYYGANLKAFYKLAKKLGYEFCTCVSDNAIFVLKEEFNKIGIKPVSEDECIEKYFCPSPYWWKNRDRCNREWLILND